VDLTFTQMLHAHKLVQKTPAARVFQKTHCDFYECHNLDRREALDNVVVPCANWADYTTGPLVIQLAGHDADTVVEAAQWIVAHTEGRLAGIDLNCG
jgi:tRNA-dihydrouridine synthase